MSSILRYKIVNGDNFAGEYPGESFLNLPTLRKEAAERICALINAECSGEFSPRYWRVEPEDYKLAPEFSP